MTSPRAYNGHTMGTSLTLGIPTLTSHAFTYHFYGYDSVLFYSKPKIWQVPCHGHTYSQTLQMLMILIRRRSRVEDWLDDGMMMGISR